MTDRLKVDRIDALDELLESEREALLAGDLAKLAEMLEPKETLIEAINAMDPTEIEGLRHLDTKVRRNQLLLDGAIEGIRAVAARMAALRQVRNGLETYGADGRKRTIDIQDGPNLERRA
ncbi:FlgN protein [Sulfitobacter sp. THAF37]|uniref:flagellar biosynthesis protein FlgN n=1 Tax=Sulfitobacter sp. THAF37 TaxID=2587855 RepID=UPI001267A4F9|nr:flagellar biosynthesis protein FlgN [Sulfitobacter sp. THAF37]QFT58356.1 FlgN protein [Sulfitobacter sp. THAF37]